MAKKSKKKLPEPVKEGIVVVDDSGQPVDGTIDGKGGRLQKLKSFLKTSREKIKKVVQKAKESVEKVKEAAEAAKEETQAVTASFRKAVKKVSKAGNKTLKSITPKSGKRKPAITPKEYAKRIGEYFRQNVEEYSKNREQVLQTQEKPKRSILDDLIAGGWISSAPKPDEDNDEEAIELTDDPLNTVDLEDETPERDEAIGNEPSAGELMNTPAEQSDLYKHPLFQPSVASLDLGSNTANYIRNLNPARPELPTFEPIPRFSEQFQNSSLNEVYHYLKNPTQDDELMNRIIEWQQQKEFLDAKKRYVKQILGINAAERLFDFRMDPTPKRILPTDDRKVSKMIDFKPQKQKVKGLMKAKLNIPETLELFNVKEEPKVFKKKLIRL